MPSQFSPALLLACFFTAAASTPLPDEPPARIAVHPPLPEPLSRGRVVIPYRTENVHIAPEFGPAALAKSPRVGHLHVSVDGAPWVWAHLSGEPVILNGLPPGPHKVLLQVENANHQLLDEAAVQFAVPDAQSGTPDQHVRNDPRAKLTVDTPRAEPLSRGVVYLEYRTEPRLGTIQVTVDDLPLSWEDSSGGPVIILGLTAGKHRLRLQSTNAGPQETVEVTVPDVKRSQHQ